MEKVTCAAESKLLQLKEIKQHNCSRIFRQKDKVVDCIVVHHPITHHHLAKVNMNISYPPPLSQQIS